MPKMLKVSVQCPHVPGVLSSGHSKGHNDYTNYPHCYAIIYKANLF